MAAQEPDRLAAVGRLPGAEAWVGFARGVDGYRLVFGTAGEAVAVPRGRHARADLLAAAFAYFADELGDPPPDLEATQADVGDLLRWLARTEPNAESARLLREAVDAVDDGLPPDAVLARLSAADRASSPSDELDEPVDAVDRLTSRYRRLGGDG